MFRVGVPYSDLVLSSELQMWLPCYVLRVGEFLFRFGFLFRDASLDFLLLRAQRSVIEQLCGGFYWEDSLVESAYEDIQVVTRTQGLLSRGNSQLKILMSLVIGILNTLLGEWRRLFTCCCNRSLFLLTFWYFLQTMECFVDLFHNLGFLKFLIRN